MAKANVVKIRAVKTVDAGDLPDGEYLGTWGGYQVQFGLNGQVLEMTTDIGIRTPQATCRVVVSDGKVTVETK